MRVGNFHASRQVFCAAFQSDRGFAVSSKAEPFPSVEADLDLNKEQAAHAACQAPVPPACTHPLASQASKLYKPPFIVTAAWTRNLTSTVELADSVDLEGLSVQVLKGQSTDELPKGTSQTGNGAGSGGGKPFSSITRDLDELSA